MVVNDFIEGHWFQRAELASILGGVALLAIGHLAWFREGDREDEQATFGLWLGSLAVAIPLILGLVHSRVFASEFTNWGVFQEVASVVAALALLALGLACRIRATAIGGAGLLATYVASLLAVIRWPAQLHSVSVVMMVGGGLFFGTCLLYTSPSPRDS